MWNKLDDFNHHCSQRLPDTITCLAHLVNLKLADLGGFRREKSYNLRLDCSYVCPAIKVELLQASASNLLHTEVEKLIH